MAALWSGSDPWNSARPTALATWVGSWYQFYEEEEIETDLQIPSTFYVLVFKCEL